MNKRAPEMWDIITSKVDFDGLSVIDLGCGTGDFLFRSLLSGAKSASGVEIDSLTAKEAALNCMKHGVKPSIFISDIMQHIKDDSSMYDVAMCFSVIPYLEDSTKVLDWMSFHAKVSLVECQYRGDGPGLAAIESDDDMKKYLNMFWGSVVPIGSTDVVIRPARRTIWLCEL